MNGNPMQQLLHEAVGIDTFAIDGDEQFVSEPWQDQPGRHHTPTA